MTQVQTTQKVQFFFVGVGKCGTSWLHEVARSKGLMSMPRIKEPYLIDKPAGKIEKTIDSLYDSRENMADFSNTYFWDEENPAKIFDYNPDAKIIITIRKPSRRIISHFQFMHRNGMFADQSLAEYLEQGDAKHIVARSLYRPIIQRYVNQFGAEQVLVLPMEQLKEDGQAYFDRLTDFCGFARIVLSEEDKAPVLKRSSARNPMVARSAKFISTAMRKLGLLALLGSLKDSKFLRGVLFKESDPGMKPDSDLGTFQVRVEEMDRDYELLLNELGLK